MEGSLRQEQDAAYAECCEKDAREENKRKRKKREREEETLDVWLQSLTKIRSCLDAFPVTYRHIGMVKYYRPKLQQRPDNILSDEEWDQLQQDMDEWLDAQRKRPTSESSRFQTFCDSSQKVRSSSPAGMSGGVESKQLSLQEQISYVCSGTNGRDEESTIIRPGTDPPRVSSNSHVQKNSSHVHDTQTISSSTWHPCKEKYTKSSRTHTVQCSTNT